MAKKLYVSGNYIIADYDNGVVTEYPLTQSVYTLKDGYYKIKELIDDGTWQVLIADIGTWFDEAGTTAYTEATLVTFLRDNTAFNPASVVGALNRATIIQTLNDGDNTINHALSKTVINADVFNGLDKVDVGQARIDADNYNINIAGGGPLVDAEIILTYII